MTKTARLTQQITRYLITLLFFFTVGFSLFLSSDFSWQTIVTALVKGLLLATASWIFFLIVSDTFVKSLMASARDATLLPEQRGILTHFKSPEASAVTANEGASGAVKKGKKP